MRISGITIPEKKQLEFGLTAIYGIGRSQARSILSKAHINPITKPGDLSTEDENNIRKLLEEHKTEGELKREIAGNIKRLKGIQTYRGTRHMKNLPARGQNTQTNSRTVRGNVRRTMGSGKRKLEKT